jgi:acyl CoA:acetate/3-ketoacid CoA transferase
VAIIRATTADAEGNLTAEREVLALEALSMATLGPFVCVVVQRKVRLIIVRTTKEVEAD